MKSFRYWADGLFLLACALYAVNRWLLSPNIPDAFLRGHFNDVLLIPCALPLVLRAQRFFGLRTHDRMPNMAEITFHLVLWSVLFEGIGPHLMHHTTADPWDVLAYAAGGIAAGLWWNGYTPLHSGRSHGL